MHIVDCYIVQSTPYCTPNGQCRGLDGNACEEHGFVCGGDWGLDGEDGSAERIISESVMIPMTAGQDMLQACACACAAHYSRLGVAIDMFSLPTCRSPSKSLPS